MTEASVSQAPFLIGEGRLDIAFTAAEPDSYLDNAFNNRMAVA